jgi:hypothetical protein
MKKHNPDHFLREYLKAKEATMPLRERICLGQFVTHEDRSEETPCFTAIVAVDGKAVARIGNDGRGGCMDIHVLPHEEAMHRLRAFNDDLMDVVQDTTTVQFTLESFLGELVCDTANNARRMR